MARILYLTSGLTSMVFAATELGTRLRDRGHNVVFSSSKDCSATVSSAGFEFYLLEADRKYRQAYDEATTNTAKREAYERSFDNREIEDLVSSIEPDVLLIDMELHYALTVTRPLGIPTIMPIVWYSVFFSTSNPPLHTSLTPDQRRKTVVAWLRLWANKVRRLVSERVRRTVDRSVPTPIEYNSRSRLDLAKLARNRGFSLRSHTTVVQWLRPFMFTGLDVMSYNPVEMEFGKVDHPLLHHVGPMVNTSPTTVETSDRWGEFARARDQSRPLIYCSLGSFWDPDREFLDHVIEVFRRRPDWDLVLGLGSRAEPESFDDVPENVLILSWAPQFDVLRHASAALTHGGISTINECITNGVPMVGYSTGRVDQDGCVARMVYHGLGVAGDRTKDGPEEIEAALDLVLRDPRYREDCKEMAAVFDGYRESARAEMLVESLLV